MGRRERPLDPDGGPVQRFAAELRDLRQRANGITYRQMAGRVDYSAPALSQAAAGERLPSLAVTLAYVAACGGDREEWEQRWRQANQEVAATVANDDYAVAPYRGLTRFEPEDREWFFGRDRLIADALELLRQQRFVAIVGPSGSGKSSLLRAGLVARLRADLPLPDRPAAIRILTPGEHPDTRLLEPADDAGDTVVVVDQFEELFTICADAARRSEFLDLLLTARNPDSRLRVVVAIRADFYGRCAEHAGLAQAVGEAHLLVGAMSAGELADAITKPATAAGLTVERALTAQLVDEVLDQPGALPLLSHALLETWRRRRGHMLTVEGYETAGGLRGALTKTAEDLYTRLTPALAALARRILLRLITPGTTAVEDTSRPVRCTEFATTRTADTNLVLDRLARARLITIDGDRVHLAHEALITAWPRLNDWIERSRERLRFHRDLTRAVRAWEDLDREPGALYRGTRLAYAREWLADRDNQDDLNPAERAFIKASVDAADAEQAFAARNYRRLRYLTVAVTVTLLVVTGLGAIALDQRQQSVRERQTAISRQLAAQALGLIDARPATAMLLSVEAYRTAQTPEARSAVLTASAHRTYQAQLTGHTDAIFQVAVSPDGTTAATVSRDQTLVLWDVHQRTRRATLTGHATWLRTVAFSPDGRLLATGGDDNKIVLWDPVQGTMVTRLTTDPTGVTAVAFSPDGHTLAAANNEGTITLWDVDHRTTLARLPEHAGRVRSLAFSVDGHTLAAGYDNGIIGLWDSTTRTRMTTLTGHTASADAVAFSPDGHTLASASTDQTVMLWDTATGTRIAVLRGHAEPVHTVAFSPDGRTLASAGHDDTVILWDVHRQNLRARLTGHTDYVYSVAYGPDGHTLVSAGEDGKVILWDPTRTALAAHADTVNRLAFNPDGSVLATAGSDRAVVLWDPRKQVELATITTAAPVSDVAFSPDGHLLAMGIGTSHQTDHSLVLWDVTDPRTPRKAADLAGGHTDQVRSVAFSPDGTTIATASPDRTVIIWDVRRQTQLTTLPHDKTLNSATFSPDGNTLVVLTGRNHTAVLWNMTTHTAETLTFPNGLPRGAAYRSDGKILAIANTDHTVAMWDTRRHTTTATLTHSDTMNSVAYSPDGHLLATGAIEHTVGLWDPDTGTRLATLTGHNAAVTAVAFSPDGHTLASSSADHTVTIWNTDPQQSISDICHTLARNLTQDEWQQFLPDVPYHKTCDNS